MNSGDAMTNNFQRQCSGKASGNAGRDGFTLLELLISMTILAMIVVIIFGAFRVGIRAWEKGEKDLGVRQRHSRETRNPWRLFLIYP